MEVILKKNHNKKPKQNKIKTMLILGPFKTKGEKKINVYKIKINGLPKCNSLVSNTTR